MASFEEEQLLPRPERPIPDGQDGFSLPPQAGAVFFVRQVTEGSRHVYLRMTLGELPLMGGDEIAVLRSEGSGKFHAEADEATQAKPGYPECVAMIVQIGDHLSKQFDVKG
jgi:hypothetical protein